MSVDFALKITILIPTLSIAGASATALALLLTLHFSRRERSRCRFKRIVNLRKLQQPC